MHHEPLNHTRYFLKAVQVEVRIELSFSNSLIIHQFTSESGYANLTTSVRLESLMKHWTEGFSLYLKYQTLELDKMSNSTDGEFILI